LGGGEVSPQKLEAKKHAKFGLILDDFKLWQQISLERMQKLNKNTIYRGSSQVPQKSQVNFNPLTTWV